MPANGILSKKTYFPRNGDILTNLEDGIAWECVRAGLYRDEKTATPIRFVLLIGRVGALGDTPVPKTLDDSEMPLPFLRDIEVIHRERDGQMVEYTRNEKGNYEE